MYFDAKLLLSCEFYVLWVSVFYQLTFTQNFMHVTREHPLQKPLNSAFMSLLVVSCTYNIEYQVHIV